VKRALCWFGLGYLCLLLQAGLLPLVLPSSWRPDLLLVLVIALGLIEPLWPGVLVAVLLGCLQDVFSGVTLGLFAFTATLVYLGVRFFSSRLNIDSILLFPFLVASVTLLHNGLVLFLLLYLAEAGAVWDLLLPALPRVLLVNLIAGLLLSRPIMTQVRGRRMHEV
jgi:rod shape-determining protein MreD